MNYFLEITSRPNYPLYFDFSNNVDVDKSIFTIDSIDGSYHFDKRVLIDSPLEEYGINYNIVRCSLDNEIVVSDKFKKVIMDNKIKCMSFIKNELNY